MAQHTPPPNDQQHSAQHPFDETGNPLPQGERPSPSGSWIWLLTLLPIACCGLLIAAGVTAGSGAVLGGLTGGVLMLAGMAALAIWAIRRHARATREADTSTATRATRDRCC
jgi:hypothetical protein